MERSFMPRPQKVKCPGNEHKICKISIIRAFPASMADVWWIKKLLSTPLNAIEWNFSRKMKNLWLKGIKRLDSSRSSELVPTFSSRLTRAVVPASALNLASSLSPWWFDDRQMPRMIKSPLLHNTIRVHHHRFYLYLQPGHSPSSSFPMLSRPPRRQWLKVDAELDEVAEKWSPDGAPFFSHSHMRLFPSTMETEFQVRPCPAILDSLTVILWRGKCLMNFPSSPRQVCFQLPPEHYLTSFHPPQELKIHLQMNWILYSAHAMVNAGLRLLVTNWHWQSIKLQRHSSPSSFPAVERASRLSPFLFETTAGLDKGPSGFAQRNHGKLLPKGLMGAQISCWIGSFIFLLQNEKNTDCQNDPKPQAYRHTYTCFHVYIWWQDNVIVLIKIKDKTSQTRKLLSTFYLTVTVWINLPFYHCQQFLSCLLSMASCLISVKGCINTNWTLHKNWAEHNTS